MFRNTGCRLNEGLLYIAMYGNCGILVQEMLTILTLKVRTDAGE